MRLTDLVCVSLLLVLVQFGVAEDQTTIDRLRADVKQLASDEWEGRGVGTEGLNKAADYIAQNFRDAGLNVTAAGGDAFQDFNINNGAELGSPNGITFLSPDGEVALEMGQDFEVCSFGSAGSVAGELVFAGYGIISKNPDYDDYENIDVKDKIVIVMRHNPQQTNPHGPFAVAHGVSRHADLATKLSKAFGQGAKAILFVNDPYTHRHEREQLEAKLVEAKQEVERLEKANDNEEALKTAKTHLGQVQEILDTFEDDPLMPFGYAGTRSGQSIPAFHMTRAACDRILTAALGKTLADVESEIDESGKPSSHVLDGFKAKVEANLKTIHVPVRNVIGVLEGHGEHQNETVVIGAHFDHLGFGGNGSLLPGSKEIHNGADDNASGTSGLLEIARQLGHRKEHLARRIVFIAFNGEERGLLGASEYVKNPLFPLTETVAMLNMDMIGRFDGRLTVYGTGTSSIWDPFLDQSEIAGELKLIRKPEGFGPSDHSAFYGKQIPVLHFFTGIHDDYHRPGDDWDKLNYQGISRVVDLVVEVATDVANRSDRPDYLEIKGQGTLTRTGSRPYFGSIPDFSEESKGYAISGVSPDSPADKGGLKGGDVIVEMGGRKIGSLDDFDLALRELSPGEQVDVTVLRDKAEVKLKVTLASPKN